MSPPSKEKWLQPVGRCIYCGGPQDSDEHIFAFSLGGNIILPDASCDECAKTTSYLDGYCAREVFRDLRPLIGYPTRRPKDKPLGLPVWENGKLRLASFDDHPGALVLPIFQRPGILRGRPRNEGFNPVRIEWWEIHDDFDERISRLESQGYANVTGQIQIKLEPIARMLAKVAHCAAVASLGYGGFVHRLYDTIFEGKELAYWVGGATKRPDATESYRHAYWIHTTKIDGVTFFLLRLRMFANVGRDKSTPGYEVVVGEALPSGLRALEQIKSRQRTTDRKTSVGH